MTNVTINAVMNTKKGVPVIHEGDNIDEIRLHRKRALVAAFRLFGKFGFDEGLAGHITVRDPEKLDHFWVNPMGISFKQIKIAQLLLVNHQGDVVEGDGYLNGAAFTIHAQIHKKHPHVNAAAHAHSLYGKTWSSLGKLLPAITQDACAFYQDQVLFDDFTGVVLDSSEGERIADTLSNNKAIILQNHGLLTVGKTVEAATWWFITMERCCQAQLLAQAVGEPIPISDKAAQSAYEVVGSELAGFFSFLPLFNVISAEQPDMFE
jgi:ribulose-5-phosphate 4-epimerase/fuculose-1-phosphate aldolase